MSDTSRYASSPVLVYRAGDGQTVKYLAPRILPFGWTVASAYTTAVQLTEVNRLDRVATRTLRNPLLAWRICDANDAMDPFALCQQPGELLQLPASGL
jgi:hypothetical protein